MGVAPDQTRRILLVEDDAPLRRIITMNLARRGYGVAEAESVETADEALHVAREPFDAILLDVNLPDQTGWDILRHLRDEHAEHRPAIILITAVRPVQHRVDEFQPDAILVKPFPIAALLQLLERLLDVDARASRGLDQIHSDPAESV